MLKLVMVGVFIPQKLAKVKSERPPPCPEPAVKHLAADQIKTNTLIIGNMSDSNAYNEGK